MQPLQAVRRYPLFALLPSDWLAAWLASGEELSLAVGDTLCREGERGPWLYVAQDGRVRVLRQAKEGGEISFGTLTPGDVLGEYGLLPPGLVPVTCRAATRAQVLQVRLTRLRAELARHPEVVRSLRAWLRLHSLVNYLRQKVFLGVMSASSFLPLLDHCRPGHYPAGRTIQAEGLAGDRWFFIKSGAVDVLAGPGEAPVRLGAGDSFGERALAGEAGLAPVVAVEDAECLGLAREHFLQPSEGEGAVGPQTALARDVPPQLLPYPWVGQRDERECGAASLLMVLRLHGRPGSLDALRALLPLDERGCNVLALRQLGESQGFRAEAVRIGLEQLADASLPAVAHGAGGHYVVIFALQTAGVVVGDPARGVVVQGREEFRQFWSGNLLLLSPPREWSSRATSTSWVIR